ncbi:MAG: hypothetical protein Q7T41_03970, partial [Candidatus Saccharibacteria bacterium]|nr:hypothetical protein [Candidatus Saccharibacteria bacterium]
AELRERQRQEALRTSTVNPPRQEKPILTYRRFLGTNPDDCFGEGSADLVGDFLSILGQRNFPLIKDLISIEKIKVPFVDPYVPISRRVASRGYLIGRGGEVHRHERGSGRYTSLYVCQDGLLREVRRSKAHPVMFGPIAITNAVTPATKNAEVGNWRTSQVKIEDTSDNILRRPDSVGSIDEFIQLDFRNKLRETLRKVLGLTG